MTVKVPTAAELEKIQAQLQRAKADALAKQKAAPRGYSLQSVNTTQLERDLAKLVKALGEVISFASRQPGFAKLYASQIEMAKRTLLAAKELADNKSVLGLASIVVGQILRVALPMVEALVQACKGFVSAPVKTISDQVSDVMKRIFVAGDLGPNSLAVKHAVKVDLPAHGGTAESVRVYLLSQNGVVKNWYKSKFGLR